ncbi:McrC family protein [Aureivirga marina]|uniref:McrC family protein n=1 Tax=Aureivirga marina TaxID=1182451 RepID=UPI0018CA6B07|nr:hypothetical protein [Aureivirga marina]
MKTNKIITVYEHEKLFVHKGKKQLDPNLYKELVQIYGDESVPYFSLLHNGVKFNSYVGVLQIGNTTIEILPKMDQIHGEDFWRNKLIEMLQYVGVFNIKAPTNASLKLKKNSILELYISYFIQEIEYLLHCGLVKKYRKEVKNSKALKGKLLLSKQLQKNSIHKEKFLVSHAVYDTKHEIHAILYQALFLIQNLNLESVHGKVKRILLEFPEFPKTKITEKTFANIILDRKTKVYENVLQIAKMLLLNLHPDIRNGGNDVLAIMFDMNMLWEKFIFKVLKNHLSKTHEVIAQDSKKFWKSEKRTTSTMQPDILIKGKSGELSIVLDTKWKNTMNSPLSVHDLRQMFVYKHFYKAEKVALIFPHIVSEIDKGHFFHPKEEIGKESCDLIYINLQEKGNISMLENHEKLLHYIKN